MKEPPSSDHKLKTFHLTVRNPHHSCQRAVGGTPFCLACLTWFQAYCLLFHAFVISAEVCGVAVGVASLHLGCSCGGGRSPVERLPARSKELPGLTCAGTSLARPNWWWESWFSLCLPSRNVFTLHPIQVGVHLPKYQEASAGCSTGVFCAGLLSA